MNKFKFYFILSITTVTLFSCNKDDNTVPYTAPKDYAEQYVTDNNIIKKYLETYYITVTDAPGLPTDQDVTITKIPDGGMQKSIWSYKDNTGDTYPQLKSREVNLHNVLPYTVYYLVLRPGTGSSPTNTDSVLTSYSGRYLQSTTSGSDIAVSQTAFEEVKNPSSYFNLSNVIKGWSEIFPQFKTGTYSGNSDGTISYNDFGAGVMFIPSGLAYFNTGAGSIPGYAPLVFSFKLYEIYRSDTDKDGVTNYLEDINGDGYMYSFTNTTLYPTTPTENIDDTDTDGIPNYLDTDDDGDGYTTAYEISKGTNYLDASIHP